MTKVYLNKRITPRIAMGHPWIYNNEVDRIAGTVTPGDIVDYALNLITIAVPPALPAAMTIGTVLSLERLKK